MYPSALSTSSTLARIFEPGLETLDLARICALRIRVMRSLIGSCVDIWRPSLPARLHEPRDHALGPELAQRDTGQLVLAIDRARAAGHFAAVANPGSRRIARHLGELQRRGEALFHRLFFVGDDRLQPGTLGGSVLGHPHPPVILLDRTLLCHAWLAPRFPRLRGWSASHCRNGKLKAVNRARASSSVRAVVHTVMSMPSVVSPVLSKSISGKMMCSLMPSE